MKTLSAKAMELVNKANDMMSIDCIRSSVMKLFELEVEALALILLTKYAMFATTIIGSKGTVIVATILVAINFVIRLIAAIKAVPRSIRAYEACKREYERYKAWCETQSEAVEAAKAAEKNRE